MSALPARAEMAKLAALLGLPESRLDYLAAYDAASLRQLREQVTDLLFDADRHGIEGVARAAKLVPTAVSAKLAQRFFPPALAARVAGALDPATAVDLAGRLPAAYLSDVAWHLEPRRAAAILGRLPVDLIASVSRLVGDRREFVTLGRFVGVLGDEAILRTVQELSDEALLGAAFVAEDPGRLQDVIARLPAERLRGVVRTAYELEMWPEALTMLEQFDPATTGLLADAAAGEDDAVLASMVATAQEQDLWDAVLPVIGAMSQKSRPRVWEHLRRVLPQLPESVQRRIKEVAAELGEAQALTT